MKRIAAIIVLTALLLALIPAAMADQWYTYYYCPDCGCNRQCSCTLNDTYVADGDTYHLVFHDDSSHCMYCGCAIYDYSDYYAEYHNYWNGTCEQCGYRGSSNPVGGYTRKLFVCSDSVRVRSQPGGGTQYATASYGDMFEYVRTVEYGNDGDPWFEVRYNGGTAYIPGGTRNSQFWLFRRACEIRYYNSTKTLKVTTDTHMVKSPDEYYGDNKIGSVEVRRGDYFTCYGEIEDELYPSRVWYLVKYNGGWFFVPAGKASVD